jgi:hypothetical protein
MPQTTSFSHRQRQQAARQQAARQQYGPIPDGHGGFIELRISQQLRAAHQRRLQAVAQRQESPQQATVDESPQPEDSPVLHNLDDVRTFDLQELIDMQPRHLPLMVRLHLLPLVDQMLTIFRLNPQRYLDNAPIHEVSPVTMNERERFPRQLPEVTVQERLDAEPPFTPVFSRLNDDIFWFRDRVFFFTNEEGDIFVSCWAIGQSLRRNERFRVYRVHVFELEDY